MPKSKRAKIVHLTQTDKRGRERKSELVERIRSALDDKKRVFLFAHENMRNANLQVVRTALSDSKFFLGKNKVMRFALGNSEESEYRDNLHVVANRLTGNMGLLATDRTAAEVRKAVEKHKEHAYARSGFKAPRAVSVPAGPLPQFQHTMVEELRRLGLPVDLKDAVITLFGPHTICRKGDTLTPEQCQLLKHFAEPMAEFNITLLCEWHDGKVTDFVTFDEEGVRDADREAGAV